MRKILLSAIFLATLAASGQNASGPFDGAWNTTVTCDAKGKSLGYTWQFTTTITDSNVRGERGVEGQNAYLILTGKLNGNGSGKLTANGIVGAKQYTHGPLVESGENYSYDVKAEFTPTEGEGERSTGLGIYGRPCHFVFIKQAAAESGAKP